MLVIFSLSLLLHLFSETSTRPARWLALPLCLHLVTCRDRPYRHEVASDGLFVSTHGYGGMDAVDLLGHDVLQVGFNFIPWDVK